jgi:hypothetical protein
LFWVSNSWFWFSVLLRNCYHLRRLSSLWLDIAHQALFFFRFSSLLYILWYFLRARAVLIISFASNFARWRGIATLYDIIYALRGCRTPSKRHDAISKTVGESIFALLDVILNIFHVWDQKTEFCAMINRILRTLDRQSLTKAVQILCYIMADD